MTSADIVTRAKSNLGLATNSFDSYLTQLVTASASMIENEGIHLSDTEEDAQIHAMYVAYLFRKRAEENPTMPRMLRYALNNRLFKEKV